MKLPFLSDRREDGRRKRERRAKSRGGNDRRSSSDRRIEQRREFVRLVYPVGSEPQIISYPPEAAPRIIKSEPEILATKFRISDLSKKSVRFLCLTKCSKCGKPLPFNGKIALTVQFNDGEIVDLQADIVLYFCEIKTKTGSFVTLLVENLTSDRIKKEQAFLLKNFPDFCRESQMDQRLLEEEPATV